MDAAHIQDELAARQSFYADQEFSMDSQLSAAPGPDSPSFPKYLFNGNEFPATNIYPSPAREDSPSSEIMAQLHTAFADTGSSPPSLTVNPANTSSFSSASSTDATNSNINPTTAATKPPKRKRENRYKNAPPSVLSRRRAQNRASQRAYRERKDQRIKDLEQMLSECRQRNDNLSRAYSALQSEVMSLRMQFSSTPPPISPTTDDISSAVPVSAPPSLMSGLDVTALGLTGHGEPDPQHMFMYNQMASYTL